MVAEFCELILSIIWSKTISFAQNNPKRLYGGKILPLSLFTIFGPFWGLVNASVIHRGSKRYSIYENDHWNVAVNSHYLQPGQKKH